MPRGPKPGTPSNNPNGRPPKERSLTEQIKRAFEAKPDGDKRTKKEIMAELLVEAAHTAMIKFPDGRVLKLSPKDWLDMTFKILAQVDGPPRQEIDHTIDHYQTVKGYVAFSPEEWDAMPEAAIDAPDAPDGV
jgi:hypothetical protein